MEFKLRPWRESDIHTLVKYANNINISKNLTDRFPHPYNEEHGRAFIEFANAHEPANILAIEVNGEAVGGIGVHPQADIFRKNAELGYWLGEPFWGQGIMSSAIGQMVAYGFSNFDIDRIFARPFGTNLASQKTLEKNGFVFEARFDKTLLKNGELQDELVYAVRRKS